jgi:hypothetical protein
MPVALVALVGPAWLSGHGLHDASLAAHDESSPTTPPVVHARCLLVALAGILTSTAAVALPLPLSCCCRWMMYASLMTSNGSCSS